MNIYDRPVDLLPSPIISNLQFFRQ